MIIYFLGCNGWIPGEDETSCFLIEHKNKLFLLDAGTGVSNLNKYVSVLDKYKEINIILSHYHIDHIVGLTYLLPYIKNKSLKIYSPGKPIYKYSTKEILEGFLQPHFFSNPLMKFCDNVECFDYEGKDFYIKDVIFNVKGQNHSSPSFRITVDNKLIYATDTVFNADEWSENYDNITLLHECWTIKSDKHNKHTSLEALLKGLPKNLLKSTYLIHKNPEWTKNDHATIEKIIENYGVKLSWDGLIISL